MKLRLKHLHNAFLYVPIRLENRKWFIYNTEQLHTTFHKCFYLTCNNTQHNWAHLHNISANILFYTRLRPKLNIPKTENIANYSGINIAKTIAANCSPGSVIENFHTAFVYLAATGQSHYTNKKNKIELFA